VTDANGTFAFQAYPGCPDLNFMMGTVNLSTNAVTWGAWEPLVVGTEIPFSMADMFRLMGACYRFLPTSAVLDQSGILFGAKVRGLRGSGGTDFTESMVQYTPFLTRNSVFAPFVDGLTIVPLKAGPSADWFTAMVNGTGATRDNAIQLSQLDGFESVFMSGIGLPVSQTVGYIAVCQCWEVSASSAFASDANAVVLQNAAAQQAPMPTPYAEMVTGAVAHSNSSNPLLSTLKGGVDLVGQIAGGINGVLEKNPWIGEGISAYLGGSVGAIGGAAGGAETLFEDMVSKLW
jgi:hypothetical protein